MKKVKIRVGEKEEMAKETELFSSAPQTLKI